MIVNTNKGNTTSKFKTRVSKKPIKSSKDPLFHTLTWEQKKLVQNNERALERANKFFNDKFESVQNNK